MSILQDIREIKSSVPELRKFGLTVGAVLAAIGGWIYWRHQGPPVSIGLAGVGAVLIVLGAVVPAILLPVQKLWMGLAVCMGFVMTRVILSVLYFVVITPIGLILRISGKDVIDRGWNPNAQTHWKDHAAPDDKGPFRQF